MGQGRRIDKILRPIDHGDQVYLGKGLHVLGLLRWILGQAGKSEIWVSTFSTSEEFLAGLLRLRKEGLVSRATLVADLKAARKTEVLKPLMAECFEDVFLGENHSKVMLVQNDRWTVSVITSQNQTYGGRAECTMVTVSQETFLQLFSGLKDIMDNSTRLDGIHGRTTGNDGDAWRGTDTSGGTWRPIGAAD